MAMNRKDMRVGQKVEFNTSRRGRVEGTVIKLNPKNVKVLTSTGERWNVSPGLLSEVYPSGGVSFAVVSKKFFLGDIVKVSKKEGVYVVVSAVTPGSLTLVKLGGTRGISSISEVSSSDVELVEFSLTGV